ncbi:MAG: hypothetical protein PHW18_04730 [Sulfuricurvum sp.]|uniref:hypothetical protein n=1 Tax=Sulfuricurvum sp. TaxID=2025608 RepID=UPI0026222DD5|nr:hypothetical protein [Sulfuricurvum sp.]MDD2828861.1 hypothetical protein [Sulfuricurvum sp.]MDD4948524.1 hypothetical protein [Sulfuricurvum sp.]
MIKVFFKKIVANIIPLSVFTAVFGIIIFQLFAFFEPYLYPLHWLQADAKVVNSNVIIGAYPRENDLYTLKNKLHVTTVISLLNTSGIPQEKDLYDVEKENCKASHLKVMNFPLDSDKLNTVGAQEEINKIIGYVQTHKEEKIYIHCYLGKHRAIKVGQAIEATLK